MANLTQSLSDTLTVYGIQPSTKYGTAVFGTDKYGNGGANFKLPTASTILDSQTVTPADNIIVQANSVNLDSLSIGMVTNDEHLSDGSYKYNYILPGGVTNDENANITSYTQAASPVTTFTVVASPTTTWT